MFRISSAPPGSKYRRTGVISLDLGYGGGSAKFAYFGPIYGPYDANLDCVSLKSESVYHGSIYDSEYKDPLGDRACIHRDLSGEATFLPFQNDVSPLRETHGFPYRLWSNYVQSGKNFYNAAFDYHQLCPNGTSVDLFENFDFRSPIPKRRETYGQYQLRIEYRHPYLMEAYFITRYRLNSIGEYDKETVGKVTDLMFLGNGYKAGPTRTVTSFNELSKLKPISTTPVSSLQNIVQVLSPVGYVTQQEIDAFLPTVTRTYLLGKAFLPDQISITSPYGKLAQECARQFSWVDINAISNINELREITKLIPKIGPLKSLKTYANLYLGLRYGLNLTVQDAKTLIEGVQKFRDEISTVRRNPWRTMYARDSLACHVGRHTGTASYHYKMSCNTLPRGPMQEIAKLDSWGLYPNLVRSWDMIPFSFVIDWFTGISGVLDGYDARTQMQYLDIVSVCKSGKVVFNVPFKDLYPNFNGSGFITFTSYIRTVGPSADVPPIELDEVNPIRNIVDLGALIIQRK